MSSTPLVIICTTVGDESNAEQIAKAAIEQRLAACVHIETIRSVYRWEGAVQFDKEFRLQLKTTESSAPALEALIHQLHPYRLPAVYTIPISSASALYAEWIKDEVASKPA